MKAVPQHSVGQLAAEAAREVRASIPAVHDRWEPRDSRCFNHALQTSLSQQFPVKCDGTLSIMPIPSASRDSVLRKSGTGFCSLGLPSRPVPKHANNVKNAPTHQQRTIGAVRPALHAHDHPEPSVADKVTQASASKGNAGPPNKSDPSTGWGPIESLTVAALDFSQQQQRPPCDGSAFTELAMWLAKNAPSTKAGTLHGPETACGESEGGNAANQEAQLSSEEVLRFQKVAEKLLGLNRNALASLLQQPPQLDLQRHAAQTLWKRLPQAPCTPAGREDVNTLAEALAIALADVEPHCSAATVCSLIEGCSESPPNDASTSLGGWNARAAMQAERAVWDKVQQELERQAALECRERGDLMRRARVRRDELLEVALAYADRLKTRLVTSEAEAAQRQRDADAERERVRSQAEAFQEVQGRLAVAEARVAELQEEQRDMVFKFRRGRWDVIEAQVKEQEVAMGLRMDEWMQQTAARMHAEYEQRMQDAITAALEGRAVGAQSDAQQPELA